MNMTGTPSDNPAIEADQTPFRQRLLAKGVAFIVLLLVYAAFLVTVTLKERTGPLQQLERYQRLQLAEDALVQADLAAFHVVTAIYNNVPENDMRAIVSYFTVLRRQYETLARIFPERAKQFDVIIDLLPRAIANPDRKVFAQLYRELSSAKFAIDELLSQSRRERDELVDQYKQQIERALFVTLGLGVSGILVLGLITSLFFWQLTGDINRLRQRVSAIMQGYRGDPLPVTRADEVGALMDGVNKMADELKAREHELELERRKFAYHEKMIAIESLAGGIAHEVGNPITAIAGLAEQLMMEAEDLPEDTRLYLEQIRSYADGLAKVTRDLSLLSNPAEDAWQPLDINQLIMSTCSLLQYDQRWDLITFRYDLDPMLPAVYGFRDQLSMLFTNILENAWDALQDVEDRPRQIFITTRHEDSDLRIRIRDTGHGMDPQTLERIYEPFFSTKPSGSGTGLGLSLCWSVVSTHRGRIQVRSVPGEGTEVDIRFPEPQLNEEGEPPAPQTITEKSVLHD